MFDIFNCKNRTLVMGILNVTPDSFSDGGKSFDTENAVFNALKMESEGADIIDIGACSTAPGNTAVSLEEELRRLKKVFPLITTKLKIPVSVDTSNPGVAEFAVKNGAVIVNDESGIFNERMAEVVKKYGVGWVVMHTGGKSSGEICEYENGVVNDVRDFFSYMKKEAVSYGIQENALCYDYGIGFGKTRNDDITLLKNTDKFKDFSPLLVGVSKKRVVGEATGESETQNRVYGSVAAETLASFLGAGILRVHDVKACADAVNMCEAIKRGYI